MATTLYLTEPGTTVHRVDERLVVKNKVKKTVEDVPLLTIKQVVVIGRGVEVSTEAMLAMVARGIDLAFFSRSLYLRARVEGEASLYGLLRFLQARYVDDADRQLQLARLLVRGKLENQRRLLLQREQRGAALKLEQLMSGLSAARDPDALRGYEGQGAALYFDGIRKALPQLREWGFERREYYPPPDPFNALLSFGYSLLTREALAAIHLVGLDPYLGFFHVIDYGRPSLALDVIEEFRSVIVDYLALRLVTQRIITQDDFEIVSQEQTGQPGESDQKPGRGGIRLKPPARRRYLELYEERLNQYVLYEPENRRRSYRQIIELQVRQLANLMSGQLAQYQPFNWQG